MRLLRRHRSPHFDCTLSLSGEDDDLDKPGLGHVCACSCRRCTLWIGAVEVCICPDCDARECGLHAAAPLPG